MYLEGVLGYSYIKSSTVTNVDEHFFHTWFMFQIWDVNNFVLLKANAFGNLYQFKFGLSDSIQFHFLLIYPNSTLCGFLMKPILITKIFCLQIHRIAVNEQSRKPDFQIEKNRNDIKDGILYVNEENY